MHGFPIETLVKLIEEHFFIELDGGIFNKAIPMAGFVADIASGTTVQQFEVADVVLEVYKKDLSYLKVYGTGRTTLLQSIGC